MADKNSQFSILGCSPQCPFFPKSVGQVVDWVYDEKIPWLKRRAKQKKFICQYDGSVIRSWDKHPCAKKLDELAISKEELKEEAKENKKNKSKKKR